MSLFDGTNGPIIRVYLDTGRLSGKFTLGWSALGGTDVLGTYDLFSTVQQIPSTDVKQISIRRGRTRENQAYQPGELTIVFDNLSGNYDPDNLYSSYSTPGSNPVSILARGTGIQITAQMNTIYSVEYPIYSGYIEQVNKDLSLQPTVTITAVDALSKLAVLNFTPLVNFKNSHTGSTINDGNSDGVQDILTQAGWSNNLIALSAPDYLMISYEPSPADPTQPDSVLTHVENYAGPGLGRLFADREGKAHFVAYHPMKTQTSLFTFSDSRSSTTDVEYDDIDVTNGDLYLRNNATFQQLSGADSSDNWTKVPVVANATLLKSQVRYGNFPVSTYSFFWYKAGTSSGLYGLLDAVQDYAGKFSGYKITGGVEVPQATSRVNSLSFNPVGLDSAGWDKLAILDLTSRVTVKRKMPYSTTAYAINKTFDCIVEAINHDITPNNWRTTLQLSPNF